MKNRNIEMANAGHVASKRSTSKLFFYRDFAKRFLDIALSIILLPVVGLGLAGLWLVFRRDGGKFLFTQDRVGLDGNVFKCYKIRTMVPNAEQVLKELCEGDAVIAKQWNTIQKLENDPRITRIGRVLRSTSIDELPQLLNVIRGDMSLVGPRPFTIDQEEIYRNSGGDSYFKMRPGITGSWQVSPSRGLTSFSERIRYDNDYFLKCSLLTDLQIYVQTISVVFKRSGK